MPPPSIVHVINGLGTGGAEMMLVKLLSGSTRGSWRHSVISLTDRGTLGAEIESLGVPVTTLGIAGAAQMPKALLRLRREVQKASPAVVQGWMYHGNLAASLATAAAGRRVPVLWCIRYAPARLALERVTTAAAIRIGALYSRRVTRIVYNSRAGQATHTELGYATDRAMVIPNGFDTDRFAASASARTAWRNRLGVGDATVLVGRIGRYHNMKDYPTFLAAAALLAHERPNVRFVLAGKGVDDRNASLAALVAEFGLAETVYLLGEVVPVNDLLAALDIACSSSAFGEAFPSILGEAMACEVPCVTTDVGDSSWIVGQPRQVVPPRDAPALAAACRALVDVGALERQRLGSNARARVIREFSLSRVVADYEALYAEASRE